MNDRAHVLRRPRRARPPIARQQFGVSTSRLQAAQRTCQHLLPATGGSLDASSLRQYELTGDCPAIVGAAGAGWRADRRPVHARPRGGELPRPHHRFPGAPLFRSQCPRFLLAAGAFAADQGHGRRMRARAAYRVAAGVRS